MKKFAVLAPLLVALSVAVVPPSTASAWAPVGQATVHPGVQVFTAGTQPFRPNLVEAILGA